MRAAFRLGSLFGIALFVHYSWFVVFALVTLSLIAQFAGQFPALPAPAHWVMGVIASGLFFSSVLIHEMAHSLSAAIRRSIPLARSRRASPLQTVKSRRDRSAL